MSNIKRYIRMFKYDLISSIRCNYIMFIFTILLAVIGCMYFGGKIRNNYNDMQFIRNNSELSIIYSDIDFSEYDDYRGGSVTDYYMFLFGGMKEITKRDIDSNMIIDIPIMFIGIAIILSFMTGKFLFKNGSYTTITKAKSRYAWILSKVICNVIIVVSVYVITAFIGFLFSNKNMEFSLQLCKSLMGVSKISLNTTNVIEILIFMVVIPCLSAISIAQIQITISLAINEIVAFICSIAIYVFSIFYNVIWLLGNGCMVQRYSYFLDNGFNVKSIVIYDIIVISVCVFADIFIMKKKNILD